MTCSRLIPPAYKSEMQHTNLKRLLPTSCVSVKKKTQFPKENPIVAIDSQGKDHDNWLHSRRPSVTLQPCTPDSQSMPTSSPYDTPSPWPEDDISTINTSTINDIVSRTTSDGGYNTASQRDDANTLLQPPLVRQSSPGTEGGTTWRSQGNKEHGRVH